VKLCILALSLGSVVWSQSTQQPIRWTNGDECCSSNIVKGSLQKSISFESHGSVLGVGVDLNEASGMLQVWLLVISNQISKQTFEVNPGDVKIRVITPISKEISPIEDWKLNALRIGNKVRLKKTTVAPGGSASGYVLFPNEKQRDRVIVMVTLDDKVLEFPFDFARGSKEGK
jgi:hypothetical protein